MKPFYRPVIVAALLCVVFSNACNYQRRPGDLPKLHQVSIVVTQEGKGLDDASVTLHSTDSKWSAIASTDSSGKASDFYTNGLYPGVAVGRYKVCVSKSVQEKNTVEIPPPPQDPGEYESWRLKYGDGNAVKGRTHDVVDKKYSDSDTTDLEIEVVSGKNEFSFDVGKAIKEEIKQPQ